MDIELTEKETLLIQLLGAYNYSHKVAVLCHCSWYKKRSFKIYSLMS